MSTSAHFSHGYASKAVRAFALQVTSGSLESSLQRPLDS